MKRAVQVGKVLSIVLLLLLVFAVVAGLVWWARMPRYAGRTVQHWFARAELQFTGNVTPEEMKVIDRAFQEMGTAALPFLLDKFTRYDDPRDYRRIELLFRLKSKRWIPQAVKDLLPDPSSLNAQNVAQQLLEGMARHGIFAQAELEQIISRPGPLGGYIDYQVLGLFEQIGEKASNSAPVVARCFASTNSSVSSSGLRAFVAITPASSPHATLLRDAVAAGRLRAAHALPEFSKWNLGVEEFLPRLGEELCSTNGKIHSDALLSIKRLNVRDEVLVPYFARAAGDPDARFRAQLLQELRKAGPSASEVMQDVLATLDDAYSYVRVEAIKTVQAIQPNLSEDPRIVERLKSKLSDPNEHVEEAARAALEEAELGSEDARRGK